MQTKVTLATVTGLTGRFTPTVGRCFVLPAALALMAMSHSADATLVTFDETVGNAVGFDGRFNDYLLSTDGLFRVEAFWIGSGGHFHITSFSGNLAEANHGQTGQGLRIARVDNATFNFDSMDILSGQASISSSMNPTTGAGTWTVFNSGTQTFGTTYDDVSAIYISAGGISGGSAGSWDNLTMNAAAVPPIPEPTTTLFGAALLGVVGLTRRRQAAKA
jgi:hypothetical protein